MFSMKEILKSLLLQIWISACCFPVLADESIFPTHCKQSEFSYLNAKMAKIVYSPHRYDLEKNGKILSICTDKKIEPFSMVAYRYGIIGKVELEEIATENKKFKIFDIYTHPVGNNIIYFTKGDFTYYVSEATAQGHGVSLFVFKSNKEVLKLFSGNDSGIDYESGLIDFNFEKSQSSVLIRQRPKNTVW